MKPSCLFLGLVIVLAAVPAVARDYTVGSIRINHPWTRATPKGATIAAGYMTIVNAGAAPDRLIGGSSPVAGGLQVHSMVMDNGVMKMRPVEGGLEVKPGETVELKPGAFHIMLMDLKRPLEKGQLIKGTLEFEKAGKVEIEYTVEGIGASSPSAGGHQH